MPIANLRRGKTGGPCPCTHAAASVCTAPSSTGCQQCRDRGEGWAALWLCLSCGWVACSDDSPNQQPEPTTRRPTIPSPPGCPAAHTCCGVTSIDVRSKLTGTRFMCRTPAAAAWISRARPRPLYGPPTPRLRRSCPVRVPCRSRRNAGSRGDGTPVDGECREVPSRGSCAGRTATCRRHRPRPASGTCRSCDTAPTPREQRFADGDEQRVERVTVLAEGVLDEPIVPWVLGRGNSVRSSRIRPLTWSTSYLSRLPFGISTSTSNSAGWRLLIGSATA